MIIVLHEGLVREKLLRNSSYRSRSRSRAHLALVVAGLLFITRAAGAQLPRVGIIDFYGLRALKPADLAGALHLQIGDTITVSSDVLRQRLLQVPGVQDASVSAVCCEAGRTILYVGVQEGEAEGRINLEFNPAPKGDVRLPADVIQAADDFADKLFEGVRRGQNEQDDSAGHSVMLYPPARAIQQKLIEYALSNLAEIREVLHNARNASQRAVAAQIIAYSNDKPAVVQDLVTATRDPNSDVRNNALRALAVMAIYEQKHPDAGLHVPFEPFIDMLNSLEWTDRNKSVLALAALTQPRTPQLLDRLREKGVSALADMARWKAFGHAAPAGIVLGRLAGMPEDQIFPMLQKNRAGLVDAALRTLRSP